MKAHTQIPPGTQILIGRAARRRRVLERAICSVFEGWSYEEIIPPMFDYYDVFINGMGAGLEEQIYRFIDREGNILALRPEFTSLVAKTVATRLTSLPKPIRLFYSGEVLRFERPKGGRQREFAQIGIESAPWNPEFSDQSGQCRFLRRHRRSHEPSGRTDRRHQSRSESQRPVGPRKPSEAVGLRRAA
jgi:ATP phosphoribosyltransferase regulatory subunit